MDDILTQIYLLLDCIRKKIDMLRVILAITNKQTELILNSPPDNRVFNELVERKDEYIGAVNDLDNIFADIFEKIKNYVGKGNAAHAEPMRELQSEIVTVTELTVKIKTIEEKNSRVLTGGVRKPPKKVISTAHAVSAYRKNKKF